MLDYKNRLYVLIDDNSVFIDESNNAFDYGRDEFDFSLVAAEDSLYIGFYKPINTVFVEMNTANGSELSLTGQYYNGSTFTDLGGLFDESRGFSRSGFLRWNRNQTDESESSINGITAYWYKFNVDADMDIGVKIQGLNVVFSDDNDLKEEEPCILDYLPGGFTSFILFHQAARKQIIQELRTIYRTGKRKSGENEVYDLTEWDLLELEQINLASRYLALSKIFFHMSDNVEDKYYQIYNDYTVKYKEVFPNLFLKIDSNDDGIKDNTEVNEIGFSGYFRR